MFRISYIACFLIIVVPLVGCSSLQLPTRNPSGEDQNRRPIRDLFDSLTDPFRPKPSLHRNWRPDLAVLPYATITEDRITIHNIRNCRYRTEDDYDTRHYDLDFAPNDIERVDFLIVPFKGNRLLAHTMLSFGLRDGNHFVVSVEARLEQGETYSTVSGPGKKFELMYLIADERDIIPLRTEVRNVDVFLYRGNSTPEQSRQLLVNMLHRANKLASDPEFYDIIGNNCTTNLVDHINQLRPGRIPFDWRVLLPGHSDRLAYELGLLDIQGEFEAAQAAARINGLVQLYKDDPNFSDRIRRQP